MYVNQVQQQTISLTIVIFLFTALIIDVMTFNVKEEWNIVVRQGENEDGL